MSSFAVIRSDYAINHQSQHDPDNEGSGIHREQLEGYNGMDGRGFDYTTYSGHGDESKNVTRGFEMNNDEKKSAMSDLSEESSVFLSDLASPEKKISLNEYVEESKTCSARIQSVPPLICGTTDYGGELRYGNLPGSNFNNTCQDSASLDLGRRFLGNSGTDKNDGNIALYPEAPNESPHSRVNNVSGMTPIPINASIGNTFAFPNHLTSGNYANYQIPFQSIFPIAPADSNYLAHRSKKWVRWSEAEDRQLRLAVSTVGPNDFRLISERYFQGTRTEVQCRNRWKKALQPGLVKGKWTKEEDDVISSCVESGNTIWSEIAKLLPGRIGEQIKDRWANKLDPEAKRGAWTQDEMRILIQAQKELGNKWSEIAKRIPGRSENSVKNRWYNQKTSDRRAVQKRTLMKYDSSGSADYSSGLMSLASDGEGTPFEFNRQSGDQGLSLSVTEGEGV